MRSPSAPALLSLLLAACAAGESADRGPAESPDAGAPSDAAAADADPPDTGPPDSGEVRPPDVCDALGLPRQPLQPGGGSYLFGERAGDFSVTELDDSVWTLSERWTGCESYVFLSYITTTGTFEDQLYASQLEPLIFGAPLNAHFFFISWEGTAELRRARLEELHTRLEIALGTMLTEEEAAVQRARFHFVVERALEIPGSLGAFFDDYLAYANDPRSAVDLAERGMAPPPLPFALAIDRDQRWDAGESLARFVGGGPAFAMASYLPLYFDHKARIRDAQAVERGVRSVRLLDTSTTARTFLRTVSLPPAQEMAAFDTLELDVRVVCPARNVFACSEWDRIARVSRCADPGCTQRAELVRWITPYWRRGEQRWVMDASPLLGLLRAGGPQSFFIELGPDWERATEWEVQVDLRLADRASGLRSSEVLHAFSGGTFDAAYNTREPLRFTPPAGTSKVELVVILSGHGQEAGNSCAEWCDHRHLFTLDGTALPEIRPSPTIGSNDGCAPSAARGVPPGQWGNWAPERAYWCPGLPVEALRLDLTPFVTPGQEATLGYSAGYAGGPPAGGDIALESYVVYYP